MRTFEEFIKLCIAQFSKRQLKQSKSRVKNGLLLERQWQMEFNRAASQLLDTSHHISPDFGISGFIDFYVDDNYQWGIELLKDGINIKGHASRFLEGGVYTDLEFNNTVILDFRSNQVTPQKKEYKVDVWYIMYDENESFVTIKRRGIADEKVQLLGDFEGIGDVTDENKHKIKRVNGKKDFKVSTFICRFV